MKFKHLPCTRHTFKIIKFKIKNKKQSEKSLLRPIFPLSDAGARFLMLNLDHQFEENRSEIMIKERKNKNIQPLPHDIGNNI